MSVISREEYIELGVATPTPLLVDWATRQMSATQGHESRLGVRGVTAANLSDIKDLTVLVGDRQKALGDSHALPPEQAAVAERIRAEADGYWRQAKRFAAIVFAGQPDVLAKFRTGVRTGLLITNLIKELESMISAAAGAHGAVRPARRRRRLRDPRRAAGRETERGQDGPGRGVQGDVADRRSALPRQRPPLRSHAPSRAGRSPRVHARTRARVAVQLQPGAPGSGRFHRTQPEEGGGGKRSNGKPNWSTQSVPFFTQLPHAGDVRVTGDFTGWTLAGSRCGTTGTARGGRCSR